MESDYDIDLKLEKIYRPVKCWEDLIKTNLDYLNGLNDCSFNCGVSIHDETINNKEFFNDCKTLNQKGLLTSGSQPYENQINRKKELLYFQNSYVEFYSKPDIGNKLYDILQNDPRIYTEYCNYTEKICKDNFKVDIFNLTRELATPNLIESYKKYDKDIRPELQDNYCYHTNWNRNYIRKTYYESRSTNKFPILHDMLSKSCEFFVVSNNEVLENNSSAPEIVLELMKKFNL